MELALYEFLYYFYNRIPLKVTVNLNSYREESKVIPAICKADYTNLYGYYRDNPTYYVGIFVHTDDIFYKVMGGSQNDYIVGEDELIGKGYLFYRLSINSITSRDNRFNDDVTLKNSKEWMINLFNHNFISIYKGPYYLYPYDHSDNIIHPDESIKYKIIERGTFSKYLRQHANLYGGGTDFPVHYASTDVSLEVDGKLLYDGFPIIFNRDPLFVIGNYPRCCGSKIIYG